MNTLRKYGWTILLLAFGIVLVVYVGIKPGSQTLEAFLGGGMIGTSLGLMLVIKASSEI